MERIEARPIPDAQARRLASAYGEENGELARFVSTGTIDPDVRREARDLLEVESGRVEMLRRAGEPTSRANLDVMAVRALTTYLDAHDDRGPIEGWGQHNEGVEKALSFLGGKQVADNRYAVPIDKAWYIFSETQMEAIYRGDGEGGFRTAREVAMEGSATRMPEGWTPERPFALRNAAGDIAATYTTREAALDGMIEGDHILAADLATGEWKLSQQTRTGDLPQSVIDRAALGPASNAVNRAVLDAADKRAADATPIQRHVYRALESVTPTWDPDQRWAQAFALAEVYDARDTLAFMEAKLHDKVWPTPMSMRISSADDTRRDAIANGVAANLRENPMLTDNQAKAVAHEWFTAESEVSRFAADGHVDEHVRREVKSALQQLHDDGRSGISRSRPPQITSFYDRAERELTALKAYLHDEMPRGPESEWWQEQGHLARWHAAPALISDERAAAIAADYPDNSAPVDLFAKTGAITQAMREGVASMQLATRTYPDQYTNEDREQLQQLADYVTAHGERGPVPGWGEGRAEVAQERVSPKLLIEQRAGEPTLTSASYEAVSAAYRVANEAGMGYRLNYDDVDADVASVLNSATRKDELDVFKIDATGQIIAASRDGWAVDLGPSRAPERNSVVLEPSAYNPVSVVHQQGHAEEFTGEYLGSDETRVYQMDRDGKLLSHDRDFFKSSALPNVGERMHVLYHPTRNFVDVRELPARELELARDGGRDVGD